MLFRKGAVWMTFRDKSLEQGPIKIVTVPFLHRQFVTVDLRSQLPINTIPCVGKSSLTQSQQDGNVLVISNEDQLLCSVT